MYSFILRRKFFIICTNFFQSIHLLLGCDYIQKVEMGEACSTHGWDKDTQTILFKSLEIKRSLLIYRNSIILKLICESVKLIFIRVGCRSKWPRGLKRQSAATRLLELRVRIPLWSWISISCECCVFCQVEFSLRG